MLQPVYDSQALDSIQQQLPACNVPWSDKAAMHASGEMIGLEDSFADTQAS